MLTVCIGSMGEGGLIVGVVLWHVTTPTPPARAHISLYLLYSCQKPLSKYVNPSISLIIYRIAGNFRIFRIEEHHTKIKSYENFLAQ